MLGYAAGCSSLTSLSIPDTSGLTSVGDYFMAYYASGCTALTSLSVPDTSGLTSVGAYFMGAYAYNCTSLTSLMLPSATGWFGDHNIDWSVPSSRLGYLYGYTPDATSQTAWQALTASGKTLYINYIQSSSYVKVQAYDAIIATITTASDASSVTKSMVKSTTWREGTSGTWLSTDCTLTAGKVYQFRTPLSGMDSGTTSVLPNIKASVVVGWDTTATPITTVGNYFMYSYARNCTSLTSLSVPDTSGLTSVGNNFMRAYASGCTSLTSLSVPDTSGLTSVGNNFMRAYANGCSSLTSLSVPDTSGLTGVGDYFMYYYANGCSALTSLILPSATGWFGDHNIDWSVPAARLGYLYGYAPNATSQTAWQALTVSGKTLYTNYIQSSSYVKVQEPPTPVGGIPKQFLYYARMRGN
jgi:hypothetical protein